MPNRRTFTFVAAAMKRNSGYRPLVWRGTGVFQSMKCLEFSDWWKRIASCCEKRILIGMEETEVIAKSCVVKKREIYLHLNDGRVFHFSADQFPLLADAPLRLLAKVKLAVGGRALRWEELDEDIQVASVVKGKFPKGHAVMA